MISPGPASSAVDAVERLGHVQLGRSSTRSIVPSARHQATCWPRRIVPLRTRQSASRPTYGEASRFVTSACSGWPSSYAGAGMCSSDQRRTAARGRLEPSTPRSSDGLARAGVAVDDRELDLALVGVEVEEQLVDLVDDLGDARVGAVDLVDDEDRPAGAPRAPCAARSASAAAGPRSRRRAAARRRPSSGRARPRRRSRRGRACRRC